MQIYAPSTNNPPASEAEALGMCTWLWMQSQRHQHLPLFQLNNTLLPAIKTGQYLIAIDQGKPVFYVSWLSLNEEAEQRYMTQDPLTIALSDWTSGNRIWIHDWISPFGYTHKMRSRIKNIFFEKTIRSLYHRGNEKGLRIMTFRGENVSISQTKEWAKLNPVITK